MKIFNKSKEATQEVSIEPVPVEVKGMTYTEFVSQELNGRMSELMEKRKKLGASIRETLAEIKAKGSDNNGLASIVFNLREMEKENEKEIEQAYSKYTVDLNLLTIASNIDRTDMENKAFDLFQVIGLKVNEILSMMPEILKCYGNEYYAPFLYTAINEAMKGLCLSMNNELPKLRKLDKQSLIQSFNRRLAIVDELKREVQARKDKYDVI